MTDEEKEFVKKINLDNAKSLTKRAIFYMAISLATYIFPLIYGVYDFGMMLEIISLLCILIARKYISKYDVYHSKILVLISIIPIGWLLIYDFLDLLSYVTNGLELVISGYDYFVGELALILAIGVLVKILKKILRAGNPIEEEYKESTDWFYEKK